MSKIEDFPQRRVFSLYCYEESLKYEDDIRTRKTNGKAPIISSISSSNTSLSLKRKHSRTSSKSGDNGTLKLQISEVDKEIIDLVDLLNS